jgi:hypothetical protein
VPASTELTAECAATAKAVGYPVPCPLRVPAGLRPFGGRPGCEIPVVGPAPRCPGTSTAADWSGWVIGSSATADEHLVLTASPGRIRSYAKVVNGPAWRPPDRVRVLGSLSIHGWRAHEVFVPPASNEGSAFAGHVVLVWTVGRHTYAVGFHDVSTFARTLRLDRLLVESLGLVGS